MPCVYALASKIDPTNVRYIGRTKNDTPDKRYQRHVKNALGGSSEHVYNWIRKVLREGDEVVVSCLESNLSYYQSGKREKHYIAHYRSLGFDLTNKTDGGEGTLGWHPSPEQLARRGVHRRGVPHTEEVRTQISQSSKGRIVSEETKAKLRITSTGQVHSKESVERTRLANTGLVRSKEAVEKNRLAQLGKVRSEESKANMKAAQMARRARET